jgi:hypothetical protein
MGEYVTGRLTGTISAEPRLVLVTKATTQRCIVY